MTRQVALIRIGGTSQQNVDQAQATLADGAVAVGFAASSRPQVQLAKLGGRIGIPVDRHPEYLQAKAARDEAQAPARPHGRAMRPSMAR